MKVKSLTPDIEKKLRELALKVPPSTRWILTVLLGEIDRLRSELENIK